MGSQHVTLLTFYRRLSCRSIQQRRGAPQFALPLPRGLGDPSSTPQPPIPSLWAAMRTSPRKTSPRPPGLPASAQTPRRAVLPGFLQLDRRGEVSSARETPRQGGQAGACSSALHFEVRPCPRSSGLAPLRLVPACPVIPGSLRLSAPESVMETPPSLSWGSARPAGGTGHGAHSSRTAARSPACQPRRLSGRDPSGATATSELDQVT